MTEPVPASEEPPLFHEVRFEETRPRGGRARREESIIVCSCNQKYSATGPADTTQNYVRAKYNHHLLESGQSEIFDLPEGSESLLVTDPVNGNKRWIVDGGINLGQVNEALEGSGPVELAPPSELEPLNPEA